VPKNGASRADKRLPGAHEAAGVAARSASIRGSADLAWCPAKSDMLPKPHAEAEPGSRRADRHHIEYPHLLLLSRSLRKSAKLRCTSLSCAASGLYLALPILVKKLRG